MRGSPRETSRERHHDEENLSAQQSAAEAHARVPGSDENEGWPAGPEASAPEGPQADLGLTSGSAVARALGLTPQRRLRRRVEFERVLRRGRRLDGRYFVLLAMPNGGSDDRLGLTVSRKVGAAVKRNRARRLLRESFRRLVRPPGSGYDLVAIAKKEIVGRTQREIDGEFTDRIQRLARGTGSGRPPAPGPG